MAKEYIDDQVTIKNKIRRIGNVAEERTPESSNPKSSNSAKKSKGKKKKKATRKMTKSEGNSHS